jgi:hypothetical protein
MSMNNDMRLFSLLLNNFTLSNVELNNKQFTKKQTNKFCKLRNSNTTAHNFVCCLTFIPHNFSKLLEGHTFYLIFCVRGFAISLPFRLHHLYLTSLLFKEAPEWHLSTQRSTGALPWPNYSPAFGLHERGDKSLVSLQACLSMCSKSSMLIRLYKPQ